MELQSVQRPAGAYQQPVPADRLDAVCRRARPDLEPLRAVELAGGTVNTVYRIEFDGHEPLILKFAPAADRLAPGEVPGLRTEFAIARHLSHLGHRVPAPRFVDLTGRFEPRDHLLQTLLPGVPATERLDGAGATQRRTYFADLGRVTRTLHDIAGHGFGPVLGPIRSRWSDALDDRLERLRLGYVAAGLDPAPLRDVATAIDAHRDRLDDVEPRLLHGDLWSLNLLLTDTAEGGLEISGVLDWEAASWGDPLADWPLHQITVTDAQQSDAFWATYGQPRDDDATRWRRDLYGALSRGAARLDIQRRGLDVSTIPARFWDVAYR